jgi:hypothetical protein
MEKEGISSLSKRIKRLESTIEEEDDLVDIIQRRQKQQKKSKLNELNELYLQNLLEKVQDIRKEKFFNVLKFTVEFVNSNINQISMVLQVKVSEELKDTVCIHFLNNLFTGEFSEEFLQCNIDGIKVLVASLENVNKDSCCSNEKCECLNCGCKKKKGFFKK